MIAIFSPADSAYQAFDWSDSLPTGVTLSSVSHAVDSPMSVVSETNDDTTSAVKLSGAIHGGRYMVSGTATLSNGEVLNRACEIKGWNS